MLYALLLAAFALRGLTGSAFVFLASVHVLFGCTQAALSVAATTELMSLLPQRHRSLATAIGLGLWQLGHALSGGLAAWMLDSGMVAQSRQLLGQDLTAYDALLVGCSVLALLFMVVLGLVPSVVQKHMYLPGAH